MESRYSYEIKLASELLAASEYAVFFGGAGVSTESGIPDFRGTGGLYAVDGGSMEYYLSRECLAFEPERFFRFFRENMMFRDVMPCGAHTALAELENRGVIKSVITQNIDGLHQKAGSKRVLELHGSAERYYCTRCGKLYDSSVVSDCESIPRCDVCSSVVRPDVTLYGEALDWDCFDDAEKEISKADVLIVGGTSLVVNPAASLLNAFKGKHLIIVNYSATPYDDCAELLIGESVSDVLGIFVRQLDGSGEYQI